MYVPLLLFTNMNYILISDTTRCSVDWVSRIHWTWTCHYWLTIHEIKELIFLETRDCVSSNESSCLFIVIGELSRTRKASASQQISFLVHTMGCVIYHHDTVYVKITMSLYGLTLKKPISDHRFFVNMGENLKLWYFSLRRNRDEWTLKLMISW